MAEQGRENRDLRLLIDELRLQKDKISFKNGQLNASNEQLRAFNDSLNSENEALEIQNCRLRALISQLQQQLRQRFTPEEAAQALCQNCSCVGDISLLRTALQASLDRSLCDPTLISVSGVRVNPIPVSPIHSMASTEIRAPTALAEEDIRANMQTAPMIENLGGPISLSSLGSSVPTEVSQVSGMVRTFAKSNVADQSDDRPIKRRCPTSQVDNFQQQIEIAFPSSASENCHEKPCRCIPRCQTGSSFDDDANYSEESVDSDEEDSQFKNTTIQAADGSAAIKRRSSISAITYGWALPVDLTLSPFDDYQAQLPKLFIASFTELDAARPWDLIFFRRPIVSLVFNYQTLGSSARKWICSILWFQFVFRRELWEWGHWIEMEGRAEDREWERYRVIRADRVLQMLKVYAYQNEVGAKLVKHGELSAFVWLDPAIWDFSPVEKLMRRPLSCNLVEEQAKEDALHPARCFYTHDPEDHPFHSSEYKAKYPEEYSLPPLVSPDRKLEVQLMPTLLMVQ